MTTSPYAGLSSAGLMVKAGEVLRLTQGEIGEKLGVSRRTIVRWTSSGVVGAYDLRKLAQLVHPVDAQLAEACATAAGTTLDAIGVVKAPPLVDIVVCAAAEALEVSPRVARLGLLAAVRSAREMGMRLEDVERALEERRRELKPRDRGPEGKPRARRA